MMTGWVIDLFDSLSIFLSLNMFCVLVFQKYRLRGVSDGFDAE